MRRLLLVTAFMLLSATSLFSQTKVKVQCTAAQGGQSIVTAGTSSTTKAVKTFPGSTVTVYSTGTVTPISLWTSDTGSVVKANPFTASSTTADCSFYATPGQRVDITFSGSGIATPFTVSDVRVENPIAGAPATTTTLGSVLMSTAPAVAASPVAVGKNDLASTSNAGVVTTTTSSSVATSTNDTRLPTQDENDALVGTSGAPGTANKYVTDADPRVPTQSENDALVGTDGTPSSANKYVTNSDPRLISAVTSMLTNIRLAKTAAYTLDNADKGKTIALGGSAFYTLTIGAASGFDATFAVLLLNEDTVRGKRISPNGLTSFILYPQQSAILYNQNNVWQVYRNGRWKVPSSMTVYVDGTLGDNANDGLAAGAGGAFATVQAGVNAIKNDFDLGGVRATPVILQLADATYTASGSAPIALISGPFVGQQMSTTTFPSANEVPLLIRGNTTTPSNVVLTSSSGLGTIEAVWGAVVGVEGVKLTNSTGSLLSTGGGGGIQVGKVVLGAAGTAKMQSTHNSVMENYDDITLEGNSDYVFDVDYLGSMYLTDTFTVGADFTVDDFAHVGRSSELTSAGAVIDLNGHTVTGRRFRIEGSSSVTLNVADLTLSFFPGTDDGIVLGNSTYNNIEGLTYTPTVTSSTGTITTVGSVTGRYFSPATNRHLLQIDLTITTNGTGAGTLKVTLPPMEPLAGGNYVLSAKSLTPNALLMAYMSPGDPTHVYVTTTTGGYPGVDGIRIFISGNYESGLF